MYVMGGIVSFDMSAITADHSIATLQERSSLTSVPPTILTQALGWEFSQNIEAMSQLKSLEHREEKEEECLEVVTESPYTLKHCNHGAHSESLKTRRVRGLKWTGTGPHVNRAEVRSSSVSLCPPAPLRTNCSLQDNCRQWIVPFPMEICISKFVYLKIKSNLYI